MGLLNHLHDVSGDSLPLFLLTMVAASIANLRAFLFLHCSLEGDGPRPECAVYLCGLADGDRVQRLLCRHIFHRNYLNSWLRQLNLPCPLCRSQLAELELRAAADHRIGAELIAWLSLY